MRGAMTKHALVIAGGGPTGLMRARGADVSRAGSNRFRADDTGVDVELFDGSSLRAEYLIGPTDMWPGWGTERSGVSTAR